MMDIARNDTETVKKLERYYKFHATIYNSTRWLFLFGRHRIIKNIKQLKKQPERILEIGCGTGYNLRILRKCFPDAEIIGIDISEAMLKVARNGIGSNVSLIQQAYLKPINIAGFDIVLCSYTLTMIPEYRQVIESVYCDLNEEGVIALVDFHRTGHCFFQSWMAFNHVRMEAHLLPDLENNFQPVHKEICNAYFNFWQYLIFVGRKKLPASS